MQTGMADYAHKAATTGFIYLEAIWEYDLYCHYVAGLVGEGLSRLFSASGKEAEWLGGQLEISNSVGLLLQKTNIIRDFREDVDERRFFWPREIWGREEYGFREMKDMYLPGNEQRASWAQSGMVVDALRHATDSLDYLQLLRNQSVFNFVAIPVTMAMATLSLCFMNPAMFQRNIKIRKAEAASVCLTSVLFQSICSSSHVAHHAIDKFPRRSLHIPRLCTQNTRQSCPDGPQLPAYIGSVRKGTLLTFLHYHLQTNSRYFR
jgi:farnesyl-diphosphate farnesyltransferase